ncbi:MAG: GntR family transcriptional regulator [Acidimicrobiales bacterium]|nr:GntR family transcriptional regulator [Acidimicrobiales bacterium]
MAPPLPQVATGFERVRLVDEIVRHLREMIITGQLPAGTPLLQTELARQFGVSRTPLREAFRILENDGIIRISNGNRTAEVATIDAHQLREMYELREVIDGLAARLAAETGLMKNAEQELRRLIRQMKASIKPFDPAARVEAHAAFHSLIVQASGNMSLQNCLPLVRVSSAALYLPFIDGGIVASRLGEGSHFTVQQAMEVAHKGHVAIFQAIINRDSRQAEAEARRHIATILKNVGRLDEWRKAAAATPS